MSSNPSTVRLLNRLPVGLTVSQVADDVYCCAPADAAAIRGALASQPQIGYFLDRQMVVDKVTLNSAGDAAFVVRHASEPTGGLSILNTNSRLETAVESAQPGTSHTVDGYAGTELIVEVCTATVRRDGSPFKGVSNMRAKLRRSAFGPYAVGPTVKVDIPSAPPTAFLALMSAGGYSANSWYDTLINDGQYMDVVREFVSVPGAAVDIQQTYPYPNNGFIGWPMVAGPAVAARAEFYPGLEVVIGTYPQVAERLEAVVSYMKTKQDSAAITQFTEASTKMKAETNTFLIAFRSSSAYQLVDFWPLLRSLAKTDAEIPVDGEVITQEALTKGRAEWNSGDWCLSASSGTKGNSAISDVLSKTGTGPITVKASGPDTAHLSDGEGTVSVGFEILEETVIAYRRAGRIVTIIPSDFTLAVDFQKAKWSSVVAAAEAEASALSEASVNAQGDHGGLGEAMGTRLLTAALFDPEEEALILPCLTPQYFWTKLAREAAAATV